MGSGSGPIGFGGRIDDRFSRDAPTAARAEAGLRRLLPGLAGVRVERAWGGPIDVSADHLPFFRTKPGTRIHYGAGYSGHGVGPAWLGGRILASLAIGVEDEWTRLPLTTRHLPRLPRGAVPPPRRRSRPLVDHGVRGSRGRGPAPAATREGRSRAATPARDGARHPLDAGPVFPCNTVLQGHLGPQRVRSARWRSRYCDVGPRDGLQNEPEVVPPETRAELVDRLAAAGLKRIEAVSFVRSDRVPQMADAEAWSSGRHRHEGVELSGLVLNERGWERFAADRPRPCQRHFRGDRDLQPPQRERDARRGDRAGGGDPRRGRRDAGDGDDLVLVRLSLRGPRRSRRRRRARGAVPRPRRGRPRRHDRRRDAVRGARARRAGAGGRLPRPQHAQHGLRELPRRARGGRARARRVGRRPRRLPLLAARDRQRRDGGSRLPARRRGGRDRHRSRRARGRLALARGGARPHARGLRLPRR